MGTHDSLFVAARLNQSQSVAEDIKNMQKIRRQPNFLFFPLAARSV